GKAGLGERLVLGGSFWVRKKRSGRGLAGGEGGLCVASGGGGGGKSASFETTSRCARRGHSPVWREKWRVTADSVQRRVRELCLHKKLLETIRAYPGFFEQLRRRAFATRGNSRVMAGKWHVQRARKKRDSLKLI